MRNDETPNSVSSQGNKPLAALLLSITCLVAACGGGGGSSTDPGAEPASAAEVADVADPGSAGDGSVDAAFPPAELDATAADATQKVSAQAASAAPTGLVSVVTPANYKVTTSELIQNPKFALGAASWSMWDANSLLVRSDVRAGGQALQVGSTASQRVFRGKLEPGKSYTLVVKARTLRAGKSQVAIVFREPVRNETVRTFSVPVTSTTFQDLRLDFTVPAHSGVVDLVLAANGVPFVVDSMSMKMRAAVVQTEPVLSAAGSTVPPGYGLAFNDEFNGTTLNRNKWFTRYLYSSETLDYLNDEQQRYRENGNHQVANGVLSLIARKTGTAAHGANYESGMVRSDWTALYGYYEARVKMPGGKGVWPAFWLAADVAADGKTGWPPEIDIFEFVHDGLYETLNMIHSNVHVGAPAVTTPTFMHAGWNEQWRYWRAPFNFNEGWHTVAVEWTPDTVTTFIDGEKIVTRTANWLRPDGLQAGPAHILLNLAIGGSWAGRNGIDDSAFPQALQIDWVRAYKKVQ